MSTTSIPALTFDSLVQRLVRDLANLIHSGATTERRLAGVVGLSQSHLHNVLSGTRKLTPAIADQVMDRIDWSLLNLIETTEALSLIGKRQANVEHGRDVPLALHSGVGPDSSLAEVPYAAVDLSGAGRPSIASSAVEIMVPNRWLARTAAPLAVAAGEDPEMDGILQNGDILLVDCCAAAWHELDDDAIYVVRCGGHSLARWIRFSPRGLYLISAQTWLDPSRWILVLTPASRRLDLIEGKVIALAPQPDRTFRRPALPFASS